MQLLIILSAVLALSLAKPSVLTTIGTTVVDPIVTKTHSQDALGQYHFGYNDGQTAKQEIRTADGIIRGAYTYVDANNVIQKVEYTSDPFNGFQVRGTNIPIGHTPETIATITATGPMDTIEVAAARQAHLEALARATSTTTTTTNANDELPTIETKSDTETIEITPDNTVTTTITEKQPIDVVAVELPQPVEDTPEVKAARVAHLAAVNEVKLRKTFIPPSTDNIYTRSFPETGQFLTVPHAVVAPNFFRGF